LTFVKGHLQQRYIVFTNADGYEAATEVKTDAMKDTKKTVPDGMAVDRSTSRAPIKADSVAPTPVAAAPVPSRAPVVRFHWPRIAIAFVIIAGSVLGAFYWWEKTHPSLPRSIVSGNGRLEADEIDIDTKFAGRIAVILADEGDMVKGAQVVARMDTRDLEASLKKAQAQVDQARKAIEEANHNVAQQTAQALLAQQEFDRAKALVARGFETKEVLDQRQQQLDSANAALSAAKDRVTESQHALEASTHDAELYTVNIADNTLVAPRNGRIQYRIANVGEVLPAGGKVFAMLDVNYVYMDIYLPTEQAGRVRFGADARIVVDAYPGVAIPAKVMFIATQAQFTPKTVETQDERDKLMFRIRVRIDPERLKARGDEVRSGLPGVTYIRTDSAVPWPPALQGSTAQ
jgi:HlyD family secretion protein